MAVNTRAHTDIIKSSAEIHKRNDSDLIWNTATILSRQDEAGSHAHARDLSERIDEVMALTEEMDSSTLDDLEGILLGADLGMKTAQEMLSKLREKADRKQIKDAAELKKLIKEQVFAILNATPARAGIPAKGEPEIIIVVGVNGTGKTTTIGKLAHALRTERETVLLCAADTFRAAAIEQLGSGLAHRSGSDQDQARRRSFSGAL